MDYCAYMPLKVNTEMESLNDLVHRYLIYEKEESNLDILLKFMWNENLHLYKYQDKIELIVINRDDYRPRNIIPIIFDNQNNQSFIAIQSNWITINDEKDIEYIFDNLYYQNKSKIEYSYIISLRKLLSTFDIHIF